MSPPEQLPASRVASGQSLGLSGPHLLTRETVADTFSASWRLHDGHALVPWAERLQMSELPVHRAVLAPPSCSRPPPRPTVPPGPHCSLGRSLRRGPGVRGLPPGLGSTHSCTLPRARPPTQPPPDPLGSARPCLLPGDPSHPAMMRLQPSEVSGEGRHPTHRPATWGPLLHSPARI